MGSFLLVARLFICTFEVYMFWDFFKTMFIYKEENKKIRLLELFLLVLFIFGINSVKIPFINLICLPLSYLVVSFLIFEATLKVKIFYVLFFYTILAGGEMGFELLFSALFQVQNLDMIYQPYNYIFLVMIEKILTFILFRVIQYFPRATSENVENRLFWSFFVLPISTFFVFDGILYFQFNENVLTIQKIILCIGCFFLLFSNAFVFYLFERLSVTMNQAKKLELLHMKSSMERKHYDRVEKINSEHMQYIHDMERYLRTIGSLAKKDQNTKVMSLLEEMNIQIHNVVESNYSNNSILNAIFCERESLCEELMVSFDAYIEPNINIDFIEDMDMISMIGNLIDNAIEAASKCKKERYVYIRMFMANEKFLMLKVENNYRIKPKRFGDGYLTIKPDRENHGIGITRVKELADKYGGFLQTEAKDNTFTSSLILSVK
jgi:signal transduction histidine kinase